MAGCSCQHGRVSRLKRRLKAYRRISADRCWMLGWHLAMAHLWVFWFTASRL